MSIEAIELMSERDRQAYADRLALELMRPVVPYRDRTEFKRPSLVPAYPPPMVRPAAPVRSRPVRAPRPTSRAATVRKSEIRPRAVIAPFRPVSKPQNAPTPFARRQFDPEAARLAAVGDE